MKRTLSLLLVLALLSSLLSACGERRGVATPAPQFTLDPSAVPVSPGQTSDSDAPSDGPSPLDLAEAAFAASGCEEPEAVERIIAGDNLIFYVENAYGLAEGEWEDAAIIRATGASAFEIAVVRCADEGAAVRAATAFSTYIFTRQGDFTGYAPDQADMAANGDIHQRGAFTALFICPEPSQADAAFAAALAGTDTPSPEPPAEPSVEPSVDILSSEPPASPPVEPSAESSAEPFPEQSAQPPVPETPEQTPSPSGVQWPGRYPYTQPGEDDMSLYDTAAIQSAWAQSDPSGLSDYDLDIYAAAKSVLDRTLRDGMSDYEKEEALYSWMIQNIDYDWRHNDVMASTPRESFTPYGGLVNRTAVCLGYATTFQLLMDLAGVECITVVGAAFRSSGDHAWNMVHLDGNWYCVDSTWDANAREQGVSAGRPRDWDYFNVTSDEMAASNHQWDYANTPEAVTEGHGA